MLVLAGASQNGAFLDGTLGLADASLCGAFNFNTGQFSNANEALIIPARGLKASGFKNRNDSVTGPDGRWPNRLRLMPTAPC
jgi:hypothetical protein